MLSADWEATYSVLPRLSCNEKWGDYCFTNEPDGSRVSVVFSNQLQPDGNGKLNVDRVAACAEAEYHRTRIEELMLIRNIYQQVTRPITVKLLDDGPQLLNKETLQHNHVVPTWPVVASISSAYRAVQVGDSIAESQTYWQKTSQGRMSSYASDMLRVEKWLQSSEDDDTYGASFVHLWTAFNALWSCVCNAIPCGRDCDHCSAPHAMEYGARQLLRVSSTDVERAVVRDASIISQEEWVHSRGKHEYFFGQELRVALGSSGGDALETIVAALRCAYVFRCRLFHEAPEPTDVVRWAPAFSHLLRQVTTTCLFNLTQL